MYRCFGRTNQTNNVNHVLKTIKKHVFYLSRHRRRRRLMMNDRTMIPPPVCLLLISPRWEKERRKNKKTRWEKKERTRSSVTACISMYLFAHNKTSLRIVHHTDGTVHTIYTRPIAVISSAPRLFGHPNSRVLPSSTIHVYIIIISKYARMLQLSLRFDVLDLRGVLFFFCNDALAYGTQ